MLNALQLDQLFLFHTSSNQLLYIQLIARELWNTSTGLVQFPEIPVLTENEAYNGITEGCICHMFPDLKGLAISKVTRVSTNDVNSFKLIGLKWSHVIF